MKIFSNSKQLIAALVIALFILTGCGSGEQSEEPCDPLSIVTFQLEPSSNGVEDFIKRLDDYNAENMGHYYNIIPKDISQDYGINAFKSDLTCSCLLVYDGKTYPLGDCFGGFGVTSFAITDLDKDGSFELYFTFSWGSGIPRSQVGYFDTASKETVIFDFENFWGESLLSVDDDQVLCVYGASHNVKSYVDIELTARDKIASIVDDDEITLIPADPSCTPIQSDPAAQETSGNPSDRQAPDPEDTFTALHGALSVNGTDLTDQNGEPIRLYGMSTHGIAWFPQYVDYDAFRTLRDDWNTNCIRLALYSDEYNGYSSGGNQEELKALVKNGIDYATELGMYVIVDWHVLNDQDPNVHKEDAMGFFQEISSLYKDHTNILYEICNEPNGYATWDSVKAYADEVIPVIRENDADAVILVGSPTWSQSIDQAAASPLEFDNVMYTLHFYAATHTDDLRSRLETCVNNGLPVFVSEFGMCDASGNGSNDFVQADKWMELLDEYHISFFCWNLSNKAETSSVLKSDCEKTAGWTEDDLSESGRWIREYFIDAGDPVAP